MVAPKNVEVGNGIIMLTSPDDPFSDGHTTGYLEFYDERHRPAFPLTSRVIHDYLTMIVSEPSTPPLWKTGRITGWIEALIENAPQTFRSLPLEKHLTALQEM